MSSNSDIEVYDSSPPQHVTSAPELVRQSPDPLPSSSHHAHLTPSSRQATSGSLMRQLFDLRKKQMQQQRMLEESINSASPNLLAKDPVIENETSGKASLRNLVTDAKPNSDVISSIVTDIANITPTLSDSVIAGLTSSAVYLQRSPLSQLQVVGNVDTVPLTGGTSRTESFSGHAQQRDENSPPLTGARPKLYNPNTYRSPPKKTINLQQRIGQNTNNLKHGIDKDDYTTKSGFYIDNDIFKQTKILAKSSKNDKISETSVSSPEFDRPISVSEKSFQDLVLEKIKSGEYTSSSTDTPAVRKFLRKGSGNARYTTENSFHTEEKVKVNLVSENRISCVDNKVKFPFLKRGAGSKRFNMKPIKLKNQPSCGIAESPVVMTPTQQLVLADARAQNFSTPLNLKGPSIQSRRLHFIVPEGGSSLSPIVKKHPRREVEELNAFEKLEELAENSSFCSNASTVHNLLQKGLESSESSTPINSPLPKFRRHEADALQPAGRTTDVHCMGGIMQLPHRNGDNGLGGDSKRQRTVQFSEQGAQVMEYCVIDDNDTISEVPSILSEASELLNVSDLEALNALYQHGCMNRVQVSAEYIEGRNTQPPEEVSSRPYLPDAVVQSNIDSLPAHQNSNMHREAMATEKQDPRHTVLQFSPPKIPANAASHAVWQAFGQRTSVPSVLVKKKSDVQQGKPRVMESINKRGSQSINDAQDNKQVTQSDEMKKIEGELESYKVLLVSKVHELENEITTCQAEKNKMCKLKETLNREKEQLSREKKLFEIALAEDKRKMEDYFEQEKNQLWREKCALESRKPKPTDVNTSNTLEIINLKEEILLLKRELDKRDSTHNFTQNKLKEKIRDLNHQKRELDEKVEKLIVVEKENLSLKHQIDRLKISYKSAPLQNIKKKIKQSDHQKLLSSKSAKFPNSRHPSKLGTKDDHKEFSVPSAADVEVNVTDPIDLYLSRMPFSEDVTTPSAAFSTPNTTGSPALGSSLNSSEVTLVDGSRLITYVNGNKKKILPTGAVIQEYYNGDRRETYKDKVVYFYNDSATRQTSYHSGVEELEFSGGQKEIKRPDGSVEIIFPDLSRKKTDLEGNEVYHRPDGTTITSTATGEKVFLFSNGQREVHVDGCKMREFPDGTIKEVRADGSTQTTYSNGRIRVKDRVGNVLSDSKFGIDLTV